MEKKSKLPLKREFFQLFVHEGHLDLDIDLDILPFDCDMNETLLCKVKGFKKLGQRINGRVEIFITKKKESKD